MVQQNCQLNFLPQQTCSDVVLGLGPWLSLKTKSRSVLGPGLGLEPRVLGPVLGLEITLLVNITDFAPTF